MAANTLPSSEVLSCILVTCFLRYCTLFELECHDIAETWGQQEEIPLGPLYIYTRAELVVQYPFVQGACPNGFRSCATAVTRRPSGKKRFGQHTCTQNGNMTE